MSDNVLQRWVAHHVECGCRPDPREIGDMSRGARPITKEEAEALTKPPLPSQVDWSGYLTLIRNQGPTPTCILQAAAACLDILKERERPFSPDYSAWFLWYCYTASSTHEDPRVPTGLNQISVMNGDSATPPGVGCCPEAAFSSRVDSPPSRPTDDQFRLARLARISGCTEPAYSGPSIEVVKGMLAQGPVWTLYDDSTKELFNQHSMALVGYNDSTSLFKFVNSWGTEWGDHGFAYASYAELAGALPHMLVRGVFNEPSPIDAFQYTGRIRLSHSVSRAMTSVSVGVEGQLSAEVWGMPSPSMGGDESRSLVFDFPLPSYAAAHWPPNNQNRWFVRVSDHSPGSGSGIVGNVTEVSLVQRLVSASGVCTPIVHIPRMAAFPIRRGVTMNIYVPTRERITLSLAATPPSVPPGHPMIFHGRLADLIIGADTLTVLAPVPGKKVTLWRTVYDPIEGTIQQQEVGAAVTDENGTFGIDYPPLVTADYNAIAVAADDQTVLAVSSLVTVEVG